MVNQINEPAWKSNPIISFLVRVLLVLLVFVGRKDAKDETAAMGIIGLIIGVVMIIMIEMYVPSMVAPVDQASHDAVNATGNSNWIALQTQQSTQAVSTVKSIGIVPQILGVVAVLSCLTMLG